MDHSDTQRPEAVAIIGMSGRFPGAANVEEFWRNLEKGVSSIKTFRLEELEFCHSKADPQNAANYVRARSILDDEGMLRLTAKAGGIQDSIDRKRV